MKKIKYGFWWKNISLPSLLFSGQFCHPHKKSGKSRRHKLNIQFLFWAVFSLFLLLFLLAWFLVSLLAFFGLISSFVIVRYATKQPTYPVMTELVGDFVYTLLLWLQTTLKCWTWTLFETSKNRDEIWSREHRSLSTMKRLVLLIAQKPFFVINRTWLLIVNNYCSIFSFINISNTRVVRFLKY